jgi:hypothetical protein
MFLTTIKLNHTFNKTLKIYTQTTEKVLFLKKSFFSNRNHNNYSKNKHTLKARAMIIAVG